MPLHEKVGKFTEKLKGTFNQTLFPIENYDELIDIRHEGLWKIKIEKTHSFYGGKLNNWKLAFETFSCPSIFPEL